jgi:hypothetical protein
MAAPFPDTPILPSLALFRIIGPRSRPVRSRNWVRSAQSPLGDPVGLPQIGFVSHDSLPNWVRFAQSASDWSGGMMDYWNGAGVVATRQAGIGFVCTRAHAPHPPGPVPRGPAGGIGFVSHIPLSGDVAPDTPIRPSLGLFRMFRPPARAGLLEIGFVSHDWHRIGIVEWWNIGMVGVSRPRTGPELGLFVQNPTLRVPQALSHPAPAGELGLFRIFHFPATLPQIPQPAQVWLCFACLGLRFQPDCPKLALFRTIALVPQALSHPASPGIGFVLHSMAKVCHLIIVTRSTKRTGGHVSYQQDHVLRLWRFQ